MNVYVSAQLHVCTYHAVCVLSIIMNRNHAIDYTNLNALGAIAHIDIMVVNSAQTRHEITRGSVQMQTSTVARFLGPLCTMITFRVTLFVDQTDLQRIFFFQKYPRSSLVVYVQSYRTCLYMD